MIWWDLNNWPPVWSILQSVMQSRIDTSDVISCNQGAMWWCYQPLSHLIWMREKQNYTHSKSEWPLLSKLCLKIKIEGFCNKQENWEVCCHLGDNWQEKDGIDCCFLTKGLQNNMKRIWHKKCVWLLTTLLHINGLLKGFPERKWRSLVTLTLKDWNKVDKIQNLSLHILSQKIVAWT